MVDQASEVGSDTAVMKAQHSWIAGRRVEGRGGAFLVPSPGRDELLANVTRLDEEQLTAAVATARESAASWGLPSDS